VEEEENKGGSGRGRKYRSQWKRKKIKESVEEEKNKERKKIKEAVGEGRRLAGSAEGGCGEPVVGQKYGVNRRRKTGDGGKRRRGCM
jgi:hypothetical protein